MTRLLLLLLLCVQADELTGLLTEAQELLARLEGYPQAAGVRESLRRELGENGTLGAEQGESEEALDAGRVGGRASKSRGRGDGRRGRIHSCGRGVQLDAHWILILQYGDALWLQRDHSHRFPLWFLES